MSSTTTRRLALATSAAALALTSLAGTAGSATALTPAASARVSDGWAAVIVGHGTGPGTLELVSPTGAHHVVRTGLGPQVQVEDVANDGRHVLLTDWSGGQGWHRLVDTRTGAMATYQGNWGWMRFTNPNGRAVLARGLNLQRLSLDPAHPTVTEFRGTVNGNGVLPSPDGTVVVSSTASNQLQVNGNATGAVLRSLPNPKGFTWCSPRHFSDATHFTASCGGHDNEQVFRFSTGGGAPVAITARLSRAGSLQWGYTDSWRVGSRQVVAAASPCGPERIGRVDGSRVTLLRTLGDGAEPLGVVGNGVYYFNGEGCGGDSWSLSRYDLGTNRNVVLAGSRTSQGLAVRSVALVDSHA